MTNVSAQNIVEARKQLSSAGSVRHLCYTALGVTMIRLRSTDFQALVAEALDELPAQFREKFDNVDVVVEPWAPPDVLHKADVHQPSQLLGFYHGVPQTRRTRSYGLVLPDKISLYQRAIELRCRTEDEVRGLVVRVLRHEIAHHFGISDDELRRIGAY